MNEDSLRLSVVLWLSTDTNLTCPLQGLLEALLTPTTFSSISIALVDDHDVVRLGLTAMLSQQPDFKLIGSFATTAELLHALEVRVPDVLIVDLQLGGDDIGGMALISEVVQRHPSCRVLVLSVDDAPATVAKALQLGCTGFANKDAGVSAVLRAVRQVAKGRRTLPPTMGTGSPLLSNSGAQRNPVSGEPGELSARLSPREREILEDLIAGLTINEIAVKHGRSQSTISTQKRNAFAKLELRTTGELFRVRALLGLGR